MFNTLTSKFTFFYWVIFFIVTLSFYFFGTFYMKDILKSTEHEKVELMLNTLKPTIALNLSFNQELEIEKILQTILKEKNIIKAEIESQTLHKVLKKQNIKNVESRTYVTTITDPFNTDEITTMRVTHSYEQLTFLYEKINKVLLFIFLFALFVFFIFYISMKKELNSLKSIANAFQNYSSTNHISSIQTQSQTTEIKTITRTANEMIENISSYLLALERFNTDLEQQVQEKVEKLRNQEKMMVHQSRQAAMGEMLESIAHQWRQPLNIIGLSCANLEMEHDLGITNDGNFKEKMQIISKNINYMSNTIDDFRDFLNPDRKATYFDPKKTIEEVYDILSAQLEHNKIEFALASKDETQLYGIENEFKQVVFVLINNSKDAIKSLQKNVDAINGKIEIQISQKNKTTVISFCDNGGGIKENIIHSIFDPYFTTKFAASGTGIGLYIAKNIVESRMQGSLKVLNTKNGCCFTIKQNQTIGENI